MAKKTETGLRDPFKKWTAGDAASLARSMAGPALEVQKDILDLRKSLMSLSLGPKEKADLYKQLAQRSQAMRQLQHDSQKNAAFLGAQRELQHEILSSLTAVRRQLNSTEEMTEDVTKRLSESEATLDSLYAKLSDLDADDLGSIVEGVEAIQKHLDSLPLELRDTLADYSAQHKLGLQEQQRLKEINDSVTDLIERQEEARKFFEEQRKATRALMRNIGFAIADRMGFGHFTLGNALRFGREHLWGKYDEKTGEGRDSTLRRVRNYLRKRSEAKGVLARPVGLSPLTSNNASNSGSELDYTEGSKSWVGKFKEYVTDSKIFHRRLLNKTDKDSDSGNKLLSLIGSLGGAIKGALGWIVKGGWITAIASLLSGFVKDLIAKLPGAVSAAWEILKKGAGAVANAGRAAAAALGTPAGAAVLPVAALSALAVLGAKEKERIEANPNDPEFKDNAYAKVLRGEASSVKQAGAQNQRAALKVLQPGAASEYLTAGPDASGKYLGGYTKEQLEAMAKGQAVDLSGSSVVSTSKQVQALTGSSAPLLNQMDKSTRGNVEAMAKEYLAQTGKSMNVGDSFSSVTAADGKSAGLAFNPGTAQSAELRNLGLLGKYGFDASPSGRATPSASEVTPAQPKSSVIVLPPEQRPAQYPGKGSMQPGLRMGVQDIPLFDLNAGDMLAVNLGVLN